MRIKDLATRATKLLTGNAYMVFDNGTKVEKVDYAELAKQIITEYNTQTLAGSTQSVKAALDVLNSNTIASFNSFTRTSSNGSFASLCAANGTYAIYVSDSENNYCYGQFTIKMNTSNKWETIANSGITYSVANAIGTIAFQGGTGTYTAKVARLAYTPSNATIEALNSKITTLRGSAYTGVTATLLKDRSYIVIYARGIATGTCIYTIATASDNTMTVDTIHEHTESTLTITNDGLNVTFTGNRHGAVLLIDCGSLVW